jgi:asparagine synthase (glutamine-hydrolysing)
MCGIAGLVGTSQPISETLLAAMRDDLAHRGPDDEGQWIQGNVGLAHRRLAVVDLSVQGHQPMHSANGQWVIVYNGEVYNFREIRNELPRADWRSTCDTEVIVEAFAHWGVEASLKRFVGMFAIAAFNQATHELWLARDRLGIKPLYYGWAGDQFVFSSELGPMKRFGGLELDYDAIAGYLRHGYVPNPHCIYTNVQKLRPGTFCRIDTRAITPGRLPSPTAYWSLEHFAAQEGIAERDAIETLLDLLRQAVRDRLVADVPLGAFLSGGYDSSLVCALMQEQASGTTKTFTIGFSDPRYNEAQHANDVAKHLGTEHTELYVGDDDLLAAVDRLPDLCDEPFADSSILPTYLVSHMARQHVTVALSGDGGDELFWGYPRYQVATRIWNAIRHVPSPLRSIAARAAGSRALQTLTRKIKAPAWGGRRGTMNQKLAAAAEILASNSRADAYRNIISTYKTPSKLVLGGAERPTVYSDEEHWTHAFAHDAAWAWQDTLQYLPDDILTKVDRASMAVSLEARVPLLDHRLVEFAATLPSHLKRRDGQSKYLLREVLNRFIPSELTDRPKMGFGVPLDAWLRGPLREWTFDLLTPSRLERQGLLDPAPIAELIADHFSGRSNNAVKLWNVLMLQVWLDARK